MGEHLKRARLDRGLQQRDAAKEIGCDPGTLLNWEKGRVAPDVHFWPAILAYLGYDPRPAPAGFGGRLRAAREAEGLSHRELARRLGLDPGTVTAWEGDQVRRPYPRIRLVFERWLASVRVPPCSGIRPGEEVKPKERQAESRGEEY